MRTKPKRRASPPRAPSPWANTFELHPQRFRGRLPQPPRVLEKVYINPPLIQGDPNSDPPIAHQIVRNGCLTALTHSAALLALVGELPLKSFPGYENYPVG